ncbi:uncharacterized protein [Ptychodera flava]|uniref:uncharacterized protein n=1 Tax=Ptychodera flava TaxID=63121 RepID=UPI00396A049A
MSKNKISPFLALVVMMAALLSFIFIVVVIWEYSPKLYQWCKKRRGKQVDVDDNVTIIQSSQTSLDEINRIRQHKNAGRAHTPYINPVFWSSVEHYNESMPVSNGVAAGGHGETHGNDALTRQQIPGELTSAYPCIREEDEF